MPLWSRKNNPHVSDAAGPEAAAETQVVEFMPERYIRSEWARYPVGNESHLVYSANRRAAQILPSYLVELLDHCRGFKPLDEHAESCAQGAGLGGGGLESDYGESLSDELLRLVDAGLLVAESELLEMCERRAAESRGPTPPIATVGVVTANRVDELERCLTSFMKNSRTFGRGNDFVVVDDSQSAEVRSATRQMLLELKKAFGLEVSYAGFEEKSRFARELAASGPLPPEVVDFALFDQTGIGFSGGKNRNALLLHTVGDLLYSTDDDAVCRLAVPPDEGDWEASGDDTREMEWWFFPDRQTTLESVRYVEEDVLGIHEQLLGKDLCTCVAASGEVGVLSLSQMGGPSLKPLLSGGGRVVVTFTGLFGDSGAPVPAALRNLSPASRERLARLHYAHQAALTSREVLRCVARPRIGHRTNYFNTTALAYDNRELLPPFIPVLRGEDSIFGYSLQSCFDNSFVGDLPRAILHAPLETRSYSPDFVQEATSAIAPSGFIMACMSSKSFWPGMGDGRGRLQALGWHLMELGSMPLPDFEEFVRVRVWHAVSNHIQSVEENLDGYDSSSGWAGEVHTYLDGLRTTMLQPQYIVPAELRQHYGLLEALRRLQQLVWRFGQLFEVWPEMVETAKRLRSQGRRLAGPL